MEVPLDSVTALNPIVQDPVIYIGNLTGGYSQATGNSHLRTGSLLGDLVARGEQLRLTLNGRYIYSDQDNKLTARNARGTIKMDFFITKRFFWFASSYFEKDTFQDLNLRTALATGPGYQVIEKGVLPVLGSKTSRSMPRPELPTSMRTSRMLLIKRPPAPVGQSGSPGQCWTSA